MIETAEIETIVRKVLNRMLASDAPRSSGPLSSKVANSAAILNLSHSLITMSSIPKSLDGIREIRIHGSAVVTPAVRDFLREAKISIVRSEGTKATEGTKRTKEGEGTSRVISSVPPLIVCSSAAILPVIGRTICPKQAMVLSKSSDDATALRDAAAGLRNGHTAAVVIGEFAHALSWQASRDERLRPVTLRHWSDLAETLAEVPTNLVILSSKHWNAPMSCNVIRSFYKHLRTA
ncbi:MAG: hypothetical protein SGI77_03940 [Pirellulaceae bacterium]|nr:hypothetical protein [Pirellulaceae bacterium]